MFSQGRVLSWSKAVEPQPVAALGLRGGPSPLLQEREQTSWIPCNKGNMSSRTDRWHRSPHSSVKVEWRFEGLLQAGHGPRREKHDVAGAPITWAPLTRSPALRIHPQHQGPAPFAPLCLSWAGDLSQGAATAPDCLNPLPEGLNLRHKWVNFLPLPTWEV